MGVSDKPAVREAQNSRLSLPSWIFGSLLVTFILSVFVFAPPSLPEYKQRILALVCALLGGFSAFFMSGDVGLRLVSVKSSIGQITLKATGGLAVFVLILWWWTSPNAPISVTKEDVRKVVENATTTAAKSIKENASTNTSEIKDTVTKDGQATRAVVQDSALSTLETMFPLAVRIPRDVDGTIIRINGNPLTRVISYDKNLQPMMLHWGDVFSYFVFAEGKTGGVGGEVPGGTIYLQLGHSEQSLRLPINLQPLTENQLRIPGHDPRPMEAFVYNPSGVSGFSLKVTVVSSDRERGREQFREALLQTSLGSYARKSYVAITEDGVRLRSQPTNDKSAVLRTMMKDTFVKVLEVQEGWTHIRMPEGREGWVNSNYLGPIK